jgi:hypothetical protein
MPCRPRDRMLPDYPELKGRFEAIFSRFMNARVKEKLGPTFRSMRQQRIFEGKRSSIRRASGSEDTTAFEETGVGLQFAFDEIPRLGVLDVLKRLDEMADKMAREISQRLFASMNATLDKHGQSLNAGGRPPSAELILEMLGGLEMSFEDGKPGIQLVHHPSMTEEFQAAAAELMNDPDKSRLYRDLMDRKREEWRARESDRSLDG